MSKTFNTKKEKEEEEQNEKTEHTSRHFVCVAIQDGPQTAFALCGVLSTPQSLHQVLFSIAPSTSIHLRYQDDTLLKKRKTFKKRSAPYHSNTSSWLLSSMWANNFCGEIPDLWVTHNGVADFVVCFSFFVFSTYLPKGSGPLPKRIIHFGKQPLVFFCFEYMCSYLCLVIIKRASYHL